MIKGKDKMMHPEDVTTKAGPKSEALTQYFFPAQKGREAVTIEAASREDAETQYKKAISK